MGTKCQAGAEVSSGWVDLERLLGQTQLVERNHCLLYALREGAESSVERHAGERSWRAGNFLIQKVVPDALT